jgi:hypothetical protein
MKAAAVKRQQKITSQNNNYLKRRPNHLLWTIGHITTSHFNNPSFSNCSSKFNLFSSTKNLFQPLQRYTFEKHILHYFKKYGKIYL